MKKDIKSVMFISNYFNHHQRPFSDAMYGMLRAGYTFLETEPISQERLNMGWGERDVPDYVIPVSEYTERKDKIQQMIDDVDVVIFGSAPSELLQNRIRDDKMVFRYSERPLKVKEPWKYPFRLFTWRKTFPQKKNTYMLCASAYTAGDYASFGLFRNRFYKWGYFPEAKKYDIDTLLEYKQNKGYISILWAGRLIGWKHPETAILMAKELRMRGYQFELNIIGSGATEDCLRKMIQENGLFECVHMLGAMGPEMVRAYMEKTDIFLFTSDFNEGWGAVLNESMNSGCSVVASHAIGSVPFLIEDGKNGLIYRNGDMDELYRKMEMLLTRKDMRCRLGKEAYQTIMKTWNAQVAAERFLSLADSLHRNEIVHFYNDGPCSRAKIIRNNWYCRKEQQRSMLINTYEI